MAQLTYITYAELIEAFDENLVRRLGSDGTTPDDGTGAPILNAIERASADVEAVAIKGGRYSLTELTALQTADNWALKGLVCSLTLVKLYERRGPIPDDIKRLADEVEKKLKQLDDGYYIFGTDAQGAGRVGIEVIDVYTRGNLNMVSDSRYFPRRTDRTY